MSNAILKVRTDVDTPNTGIEANQQLSILLSGCLADTYLLMVKTQGYHWNVVGPLFHSIHQLTEEHYTNLFAAVDQLGERIRALGYPAPTSITQLISLSEIAEDTGNPATEDMLKTLCNDHEILARRFRSAISQAEAADDHVTADMLTDRIAYHEKAIWMLRSLLAK
jgi:starvation-inducible DNA-binding protein